MATIGFKGRARQHQIWFRQEVLKAARGEYDTFLTDTDAMNGLIFFDGFGIFERAKDRYDIRLEQNKACFSNMLRSEHIPFNFFIPLAMDLEFARDMLNWFVGGIIKSVTRIEIEHAPVPEKALKDKTSFDVYIEFIHQDGNKGVLGVEVKYTEGAYKLKEHSKEEKEINNPDSRYNTLTSKIGLYRKEIIESGVLKTDEYRQVWRNQLLGESMTRINHPESVFSHFISVILYPEGNDHFRELIPAYTSFLVEGSEGKLVGITYEEFLQAGRELATDPEFLRWLQYLKERYIVKGK